MADKAEWTAAGVLTAVFGAVASCAAVHMGFAFVPGLETWLHATGAKVAGAFGIEQAGHVHAAFSGAAGAGLHTAPGHFCPADALISQPSPALSEQGVAALDMMMGG